MTIKKKALGRGLSALLDHSETDVITRPERNSNGGGNSSEGATIGSISSIKIEQIETNPFQPRTHFEEEALLELADSIKTQGIIQPITVRKMGYDKYQLISGERRFRASQIAGLTEIPAYIRIANDQAMLELALLENIQRENLDAIEVAISYKRLIEECNLTQEELSEKMSKQRSTITNYLRLLKLPAEIQLGIRDKKISMGHARTLINIEDEEAQLSMYEMMIEKELSVRQVEELVRNYNKKTETAESKSAEKPADSLSFEHQKLVNDLQTMFSKNIELKKQPNGKGKIVISFSSEEELENIMKTFSELI